MIAESNRHSSTIIKRNTNTMTILSSAKRVSIAAFTFLSLFHALNANANPLEGMPSGTYNVDITHASVIWKVSHFGFSTYVGRFNDFSADITLDAENFENSRVAVDIKVDSLDTDYPYPEKEDFNKELAEDWFKSAEHPSITFTATSVSPLEGSSFTINGDLTLMGETHSVSLDATLNGSTPLHPFAKVPLIGFSATTSINRTIWGLSKYAPKIGAQVSIEIEGEFLNKAK
ncbi:MAG: polyisoprenoid-binding protein YceI [Arenicella sp.]|jgi:polyisoprenoid-binding protein YceI